MRARLRGFVPLILAGLALAAAVALPAVGHMLTTPQRAGDYATTLRAHVAWGRAIAVGLAFAAALALARVRRADAARGARQGIVILLAASTLGVAAALPSYDAWIEERISGRYLDASGWARQDGGWPMGPEGVMVGFQDTREGHVGPVDVPFPHLEKGDEYHLLVTFASGVPAGFYRSDIELRRPDACTGWEAQMPQGGIDSTGPVPMSSVLMRTCTARDDGDNFAQARWGRDEPVDTHVGVLVRPAYANVVEARHDESVALVAGALALFAFATLAVTLPRAAPGSRAELAALALGPALACATWAAAALAPRGFDPSPEEARAAASSFAILATLLALAMGALVAAAWREDIRARDALRWSGYLAAALAAFAPVAAARAWRYDVPWVILGMLGTLAVAALALAAAERIPKGDTPPRDDMLVTPT